MKQLFIVQCSGYPTYWNTSYEKEEHLVDHKSFISSLNILFNKEHVTWWLFSFKLNTKSSQESIEKILLQVLILFEESNFFLINMANILTAVKEGIQSYEDKVYSRNSFNHMSILTYWIFWIIVIIVLFQKFRLSKHVSFLHFTHHSSVECIKTFQNITNNAVIFKMVKNITK
jgi:hypothetical protein